MAKRAWNIIKDLSAVIGILSMIAGGAWWLFNVDSRAFSSMENRANGEKILEAIDPIEMAKKQVRDSLYMEQTKYSRDQKQKTLDSIKEAVRYNDSINFLNAEQISILRTEMEERDSIILKAIKDVQ